MATIDMNNLSDEALDGMIILYEMQKNQYIVDGIVGRSTDNGYGQTARNLTNLQEEKIKRGSNGD